MSSRSSKLIPKVYCLLLKSSPEKEFFSKGRLGPGEIIGVRIEKGKVFSNKQIKDYLAKEYKHFNSQIIDLDYKLTISDEKNSFSGDDLRSCLLYTSPSPRDKRQSRMPSSA